MLKAVIIDDEEPAREIIKAFLKAHDNIGVVAECKNGFEGVKAINDLKPDVVFLDIQMPKLNGFEMLELLDVKPVIIFSTAYDEYAIKAFEHNAADYLLKPYSPQRFNEAVKKALNKAYNNENKAATEELKNHLLKEQIIERIAIRSGSNITILPIHKITYIEAQDDYVAIYSEEKKYLKQYTMKYLESALPKDHFARVHRSYIVRIDQIKRLEAMTKDSYIAILKYNDTEIPVSRSGYQQLKQLLGL